MLSGDKQRLFTFVYLVSILSQKWPKKATIAIELPQNSFLETIFIFFSQIIFLFQQIDILLHHQTNK